MTVAFNQKDKYISIQLKEHELDQSHKKKVIDLTVQFLKKGNKNFIMMPVKPEQVNSVLVELVHDLRDKIENKGGLLLLPARPKNSYLKSKSQKYFSLVLWKRLLI